MKSDGDITITHGTLSRFPFTDGVKAFLELAEKMVKEPVSLYTQGNFVSSVLVCLPVGVTLQPRANQFNRNRAALEAADVFVKESGGGQRIVKSDMIRPLKPNFSPIKYRP